MAFFFYFLGCSKYMYRNTNIHVLWYTCIFFCSFDILTFNILISTNKNANMGIHTCTYTLLKIHGHRKMIEL